MSQLSIRLSKEDYATLDTLAQATGSTMEGVVVDFVAEGLKSAAARTPKNKKAARSGEAVTPAKEG